MWIKIPDRKVTVNLERLDGIDITQIDNKWTVVGLIWAGGITSYTVKVVIKDCETYEEALSLRNEIEQVLNVKIVGEAIERSKIV